MCIAIVTKPNTIISDEHLLQSYTSNPDGCGLAWIGHGGRLKTYKTLDFERFKKAYADICEKYPESSKLIHFRVKTHGEVDINNCHPFVIDQHHAFIHNGTISMTAPPLNSKFSDTFMFNHHILKNISANIPDWMNQKWVQVMLSKMIDHSKIAVLRADNTVLIVNEHKGHWNTENDTWYSNDTYKQTRVKYYGSGVTYSRLTKKEAEDLIASVAGAEFIVYGYTNAAWPARYNQKTKMTEAWDKAYFRWRPWNNKEKYYDWELEKDLFATPHMLGWIWDKDNSDKQGYEDKLALRNKVNETYGKRTPKDNVLALPFNSKSPCELCGELVNEADLTHNKGHWGDFTMCETCAAQWTEGAVAIN